MTPEERRRHRMKVIRQRAIKRRRNAEKPRDVPHKELDAAWERAVERDKEMTMKHEYIEHCNNEDCGGTCHICTLAMCKVCNLAEGELTTDCPGERPPQDYADKVFAGQLDYVNGLWIQPLKKD